MRFILSNINDVKIFQDCLSLIKLIQSSKSLNHIDIQFKPKTDEICRLYFSLFSQTLPLPSNSNPITIPTDEQSQLRTIFPNLHSFRIALDEHLLVHSNDSSMSNNNSMYSGNSKRRNKSRTKSSKHIKKSRSQTMLAPTDEIMKIEAESEVEAASKVKVRPQSSHFGSHRSKSRSRSKFGSGTISTLKSNSLISKSGVDLTFFQKYNQQSINNHKKYESHVNTYGKLTYLEKKPSFTKIKNSSSDDSNISHVSHVSNVSSTSDISSISVDTNDTSDTTVQTTVGIGTVVTPPDGNGNGNGNGSTRMISRRSGSGSTPPPPLMASIPSIPAIDTMDRESTPPVTLGRQRSNSSASHLLTSTYDAREVSYFLMIVDLFLENKKYCAPKLNRLLLSLPNIMILNENRKDFDTFFLKLMQVRNNNINEIILYFSNKKQMQKSIFIKQQYIGWIINWIVKFIQYQKCLKSFGIHCMYDIVSCLFTFHGSLVFSFEEKSLCLVHVCDFTGYQRVVIILFLVFFVDLLGWIRLIVPKLSSQSTQEILCNLTKYHRNSLESLRIDGNYCAFSRQNINEICKFFAPESCNSTLNSPSASGSGSSLSLSSSPNSNSNSNSYSYSYSLNAGSRTSSSRSMNDNYGFMMRSGANSIYGNSYSDGSYYNKKKYRLSNGMTYKPLTQESQLKDLHLNISNELSIDSINLFIDKICNYSLSCVNGLQSLHLSFRHSIGNKFYDFLTILPFAQYMEYFELKCNDTMYGNRASVYQIANIIDDCIFKHNRLKTLQKFMIQQSVAMVLTKIYHSNNRDSNNHKRYNSRNTNRNTISNNTSKSSVYRSKRRGKTPKSSKSLKSSKMSNIHDNVNTYNLKNDVNIISNIISSYIIPINPLYIDVHSKELAKDLKKRIDDYFRVAAGQHLKVNYWQIPRRIGFRISSPTSLTSNSNSNLSSLSSRSVLKMKNEKRKIPSR